MAGLISALLCGAVAQIGPARAAAPSGSVSEAVQVELQSGVNADSYRIFALRRFYAERQNAPAWFDSRGLNQDGQAVLAVIARSASDGLDPATYGLSPATGRIASDTPAYLARRDTDLTSIILGYITDLHAGRSGWKHIDRDVDLPEQSFDVASGLARALANRDLGHFLASLAPQQRDYAVLKSALARYQDSALRARWKYLEARKTIDPIMADPAELDALRTRLLEEDSVLASGNDRSPEVVLAALQRFQTRNGLASDGRAGPLTLAALNIAPAARAAQIAANMERLRWLPSPMERSYVMVNVPDAMLSVVNNGRKILTSRVIVGRPRNPTPIFRAEITRVVANPAWEIPVSIARNEILPKLRRNPSYLAAHNMIVKNAPGDRNGASINWHGASAGQYVGQLQQLPGEDNSLGALKLVVTDRFSVYLHDTPARSLFAHDQRFFSHGCIRVQAINSLATYIKTGRTDTDDQLEAAISSTRTQEFPAATRMPIYVWYQTAFAADDGSLQFRPDIYGRDARLVAAMSGVRYAQANGAAGNSCSRPG